METRAAWLRRGAAVVTASTLPFSIATKIAVAQTQAAGIPLTALVLPTVDATPFYYAARNGAFASAGLDLTFKPITSGNLAIEAIVAGSGQIALANTLSLAQAHAHNIPVVALFGAGFHAPDAPIVWIFAGADSGIRRAKDLEGRVVAVTGLHDLLSLAVRAWLGAQGVDSTKVRFLEIPQAQMLPALQQKRVDAIASFEPFATAVVNSGSARMLATPYDAIAKQFNVTVWFAYRPWLERNRDAAARFVRVMRDASAYTNAHLSDVVPIVASYTGIAPEMVQRALRAKTSLDIVPGQLQPVIDTAAKFGELSAAFPAREMLPNPPL